MEKYFSQGYVTDDGLYVFEIQMWLPEVKLLWKITGKDTQESYETYLKQPLFDGKPSGKLKKKLNGWMGNEVQYLFIKILT